MRVSTDQEESVANLFGNIPVDHVQIEEQNNGVIALQPFPPVPPIVPYDPPQGNSTALVTTQAPVKREEEDSIASDDEEDDSPPHEWRLHLQR